MLVPIVTNAQNAAANKDAKWVRLESVILNSFLNLIEGGRLIF
jgi:hypothetical protein